jgi:glycerol-3-phosphate dehydrogenase
MADRKHNLFLNTMTDTDLLIVGGGINGAGIARDAAGRGLRVLLCEKDDLAAHTSSASTKLIHGGLRYIEHYEFNLVRKALREREVLIGIAPHIIWPLRFVMPHDAHLRPAWLIRAGLLLYDHLARRRFLPGSEAVQLRQHIAGGALDPRFTRGFVYSDGWVDDARLVVLNALDAARRGATVLTRTRCVSLRRDQGAWTCGLQSPNAGVRFVRARAVVNAAGPWVAEFLETSTPVRPRAGVRLVKGSHIVVPRMFDHRFAYIFQNPDKRIIFAIPYEHDFTLIGTTDVEFTGDAQSARISSEETAYLCEMASRYFVREVRPAHVVWSYAGVRPLREDESTEAMSVTRDYSLELDVEGPPLLSVFGGKITTYRRLAEEALELLAPRLDASRRGWTARAPLPGGDMPRADFSAYARAAARRYPWLDKLLRARYLRLYGTRIDALLQDAAQSGDLGEEVVPGLFAREILFLQQTEWALSAEDILWRRTKLGLHLPADSAARVDQWLRRRAA